MTLRRKVTDAKVPATFQRHVGPFSIHCPNCGWARSVERLATAVNAITRHRAENSACRKDTQQVWDSQGREVKK